jgi:predicted secreted protein
MLLKKAFFFILGALVCAACLWAGDTASFVDLGFSSDGRFYAFGQYGVQARTLKPWADLYVVDVARNEFVAGGRILYVHDSPIIAGQDGSGVFYRLVGNNKALMDRHGVNSPNQGQPLYISLDPYPAVSGETIDFRDFSSGNSFQASLVPTVEGIGRNLRSSFYINLSINSTGGSRRYTVGNPQIKRPMISQYNISRVIMNSSGNSLIFIIEMKVNSDDGPNIRYMVETLRL